MTKYATTIGFLFGLVMLALAFFNAPGAGSVEARESGAICSEQPVALDEGYGISRIELRKVCK